MTLAERIQSELTTAMKTQDAARTGVLRLIKTSLTNERIKLGHELTEEEVLKIIQHEAKQRRDSIEAYNQAGRSDLATEEQAELDLITQYLPQQMDEAELRAVVDQVVADMGSDKAQMGKIIGKVIGLTAGKADGASVSRLVKERLG